VRISSCSDSSICKRLGFWVLLLFAIASMAAWQIGGAAPASAQAKTKVNAHDGATYVLVTAGTFQMGCSPEDANCKDDEKPPHSVKITKTSGLARLKCPRRPTRR
jgi:formylglycine-generating enzyme required for sulfatase activity